MKITRSDFNYKIKDNVIEIIDLNQGGMSVTNDIENVVKSITKIEQINPDECTIYYLDSVGDWTGWDSINQSFYPWPNGSII